MEGTSKGAGSGKGRRRWTIEGSYPKKQRVGDLGGRGVGGRAAEEERSFKGGKIPAPLTISHCCRKLSEQGRVLRGVKRGN